jgi:hypothetical protein
MVALSEYGTDRFYVLSFKKLQELMIEGHCAYLAKHGGIRPKKHDSFHCALNETQLSPFKDKWLAAFRDHHGLLVNETGAEQAEDGLNSSAER